MKNFYNKINKDDAHYYKQFLYYINSIKSRIDFFFRLNKITIEKIEILEKCTKLNLNNYKNKLKS